MHTSLKSRKTSLQTELRILEEQSKNSLTFNDGEVMQALMNLREMVKNPRDEDNLKQVYARFVDCIEVHEGYVTIALKNLPILDYRRNSYPILNKKMPPLEFHQMVAWNGGGLRSLCEPFGLDLMVQGSRMVRRSGRYLWLAAAHPLSR